MKNNKSATTSKLICENHQSTLSATAKAVRVLILGAVYVSFTPGASVLAQNAPNNTPTQTPLSTQNKPTALPQASATPPLVAANTLSDAIGRIWAIEDASVLQPNLSVSSVTSAGVKDGKLVQDLKFNVYLNYAAFISRAEILIYEANDTEQIKPIAVLPFQVNPFEIQKDVVWSPQNQATAKLLKAGDKLTYQVKAYDKEGRWDRTTLGTIDIVNDVDKAQILDRLKADSTLEQQNESQLLGQSLEDYLISTQNLGQNQLEIQNIPLVGSRVRVRGQQVPEGVSLKINGQSASIDTERKFVMEYLLPVGQYQFEVLAKTKDRPELKSVLNVQVKSQYLFMLGMADFTYSKNSYSGQVEAVSPSDYERFTGNFTDGRIAFYLKGKIKGKYLITAQADTLEKETKDLFKNFFKADREDKLRRIDPEVYYPVYGDDSVTTRDVDTSGRLYVRLDWDKSSALWGNVKTEIDSNTLASYNREHYGAMLNYRTLSANQWGEANHQTKLFAAEQQTSPGRSELLGTGGSLYYLKDTDVVPNSEKVSLELRDRDSGRVINTYEMKAGRDYELDAFQGRLVLSRPLLQITKDNSPTQDQPLDGIDNVLVVSYEYYPEAFDSDNKAAGVQIKQWVGDHVAVGATYVKEDRAGQDFELKGADITLQAAKGTSIKFEKAQSEALSAPRFYSNDGGLTFTQIQTLPTENANIEGESSRVEAQVNLRELGWADRNQRIKAWASDKDAGFSSEHTQALGKQLKEHGAEYFGDISEQIQLLADYKKVETQSQSTDSKGTVNLTLQTLQRQSVGLQWKPRKDYALLAELQRVQLEETAKEDAQAQLLGLRLTHDFSDRWLAYIGAQFSTSEKNYDPNDAVSIGTRYAFAQGSSVGLDYTDGDRGSAISASAEYKRTDNHSVYSSYTYAPQTSESIGDSLIASRSFSKHTGWTLGQRWQLGQQWRLTQEHQILRDENGNALTNSLGLDFTPKKGWTFGTTLQKGTVEALKEDRSDTDRQAISFTGGYTDEKINWSSKLEYRQDESKLLSTGEEKDQSQWLTNNKLSYKVSDNWRALGKAIYSETKTDATGKEISDAKLVDLSLGFAHRPVTGRLHTVSKVQYYYDRAPAEQTNTTTNKYDQRSIVASVESTYQFNKNWEFAGKLAKRVTEMRAGRGEGQWFSNDAKYAAAQIRLNLWDKGIDNDERNDANQKTQSSLQSTNNTANTQASQNQAQTQEKSDSNFWWTGASLMAEYRWLKVEKDGVKEGALIALEKEVGPNLRLGVGYNFTDFSSDLTQLSYKHKGWFFNIVGRFGI